MPNTSNGGQLPALDSLSALDARPDWHTGQQTIQQADTPEALPDVAGQYVAVKALPGNSGPVELRANGAAAGWPLAAGKGSGLLPIKNAQLVEIVGAAGYGVAFYVIK